MHGGSSSATGWIRVNDIIITNKQSGGRRHGTSVPRKLSLSHCHISEEPFSSLTLSLARRSVVGGTLLNKYSWQSVRVNDIQDFKVKQGR